MHAPRQRLRPWQAATRSLEPPAYAHHRSRQQMQDAHISLSGSPPRSLVLVQSPMHVSFYLGAVKPNVRQDAIVEGLQVSDMASDAQVQRLALARSLELSLPP